MPDATTQAHPDRDGGLGGAGPPLDAPSAALDAVGTIEGDGAADGDGDETGGGASWAITKSSRFGGPPRRSL